MKALIWIVSLLTTAVAAQTPTGEAILKQVDANRVAGSRVLTSKMIIQGPRATRTVESISYARGVDSTVTEYLAPPREKGTKMLKLGDQLWTYSPSSDRIIKISGHMLRQSVMGADLSYEDLMEEPRLHRHYDATVSGTDTLDGRPCRVLNLTGRTDDLSYPRRKLWVDQNRPVVLREERYARSGTLLKTATVEQVERIDDRWIATRMVFKDELKRGNGTVFMIDEIEFGVEIEEYRFTKAVLRR